VINLPQDFPQLSWSESIEQVVQPLIRMAIREDLGDGRDWSTWASVPADISVHANVVSREFGVVCGLKLLPMIQAEFADMRPDNPEQESQPFYPPGKWRLTASDGDRVEPGTVLARWEGSANELLTIERTGLNFLSRLSGIATQTRHFVDAVAGTGTAIYDTRKTTPGWRMLEKYAVRCGGGRNHRMGLYSAVMLKDNHLASAAKPELHAAEAIKAVISRSADKLREAMADGILKDKMIFQVEVDSLHQLQVALQQPIDLILLDNMTLHELRQAVTMRESSGRNIPLEASGGINLANVAQVAATGVDRISIGALTHSVTALDIGLDISVEAQAASASTRAVTANQESS